MNGGTTSTSVFLFHQELKQSKEEAKLPLFTENMLLSKSRWFPPHLFTLLSALKSRFPSFELTDALTNLILEEGP